MIRKVSPIVSSTAALALLILVSGPAQAADGHQIILELEFDCSECTGDCPSDLVTVSAQSCSGTELAAELQAELRANDLDAGAFGAICGFGTVAPRGQCVWTAPAGCERLRERATLEPATEPGPEEDCSDDTALSGMIFRATSLGATVGAFNFDIFE